MKVVITLLLTVIILSSCNNEDGYYSFLTDPDTKAETVRMKFVTSASQPAFDYTIQAKEMVIDWGDGTGFSEYVLTDNINEIDSIKALSRPYSAQGTYDVVVKAIQMRGLLLLQTGDKYLTELSLTDCPHLRKLNCDNQPIPELDISHCPELRILSCGYPEGELTLTGISVPRKLGELYINGPMDSAKIELLSSDSLRIVGLRKTNLTELLLGGLEKLTAIQIDSCSGLTNIYIGRNWLLSEVVLTDNVNLDAGALDDLFESLPPAGDDRRYITLSGNKGDDRCNRNIAASKGWTFR